MPRVLHFSAIHCKSTSVTSKKNLLANLTLTLWLQEEQLFSSEREKETVAQSLTRKEAQLARAEEIIKREQQQKTHGQRVGLVCVDLYVL